MTQFAVLWRDPAIRLVILCLLLLGVLNSSIYPYQSLIGLTVAGLTETQFSAVLILASGVAVSASVLLGMLADRRAARRRIAIGTALVATVGVTLMLLAPGPVVMVVAHGLLFPVASSLYGQFFALARLAREGRMDLRRLAVRDRVADHDIAINTHSLLRTAEVSSSCSRVKMRRGLPDSRSRMSNSMPEASAARA